MRTGNYLVILLVGFILSPIQKLYGQQPASAPGGLSGSFPAFKDIPGFCEPFKERQKFYAEAPELRNVFSPFLYPNFIPHGAVFCRMENLVLEKYNFHIRIHAGDIDMYRRMIDERRQPD